jgi:uncharacterized protein (TIGR02996 family)
MSERESLLQAIHDEPDNDAVRLVFADWLDDAGEDDCAAFVRAQCAAAALPSWDAERRLLLWQAARLAGRHLEWRQGLPELDGVTWGRFERGFLAEAIVRDFATLTRHADAIGRVGTVSAVAVLRPERSRSLASLPRIPWLRSLVLDAELQPPAEHQLIYSDGTAALAEAPLLGTLRELRLEGQYPDDGVRALARSPHLGGLTSLSISGSHRGGDGAWAELLASPNTRGLRRLSLRGPHGGVSVRPGFRSEVARIVAEAANLSGLESLDISSNSVDPASYTILFASAHLAGLRELTAHLQVLTPDKLQPFAGTRVKLRLKALDVSVSSFRREGLQHLLKAPCLAELERLSLADSGLVGPDGELLAGARWRTTLTSLDLSGNRLQGAGLRRLFASEWPRLRVLRLAKAGLKAPALRVLTGWAGLPRLGALDLSGSELSADAEALLRQAGLPAAARLALGGAKAGDDGEEW